MQISASKKTLRCATLLLMAWLLSHGLVPATQGETLVGRPLAEALTELQRAGLKIFFTTNVVRPELLVQTEPTAADPLEKLRLLLAPHGLTFERGPGGRLVVVAMGPSRLLGEVRDRRSTRPIEGVHIEVEGTTLQARSGSDGFFELSDLPDGSYAIEAHLPGYVIARAEDVQIARGETTELVFELEATLLALDEIVVTPSRVSLLSDAPVSAVDLDREELLALPHLGDDIFRAFTLLPGVSGEEVSARFSVRGGREDEVLVLLDRLELYEPYHLKDFSSSISIVPPRTLDEVQLLTGGFPAWYGDRMGGVLDMTTRQADQKSFVLGLGVLNAEAGGLGRFAEERGSWLVSLRRGFLDLALDFLGQQDQPHFWDVFGKVDFQTRPERSYGLRFLNSYDSLDTQLIEEDGTENYRTRYGSTYLWFDHQAIFGPKLFVDSIASFARVERDRNGNEFEFEEGGFDIQDERTFELFTLEQDWQLDLGQRNYLRWGFDARTFDNFFDYRNDRELEDPFEEVRSEPRSGTRRFLETLEGESLALYASDRVRLSDPLTLELGLRYDRATLTDDSELSPRVHLAYSLSSTSTLRLAWGLFSQTQRSYELQVADGETRPASAERTEHWVAGYERTFSVGEGRQPLFFRLEGYHRDVANPRARFENLYEPVSQFPEIEADRIRIAPESSRAYGIEALLRGRLGDRAGWWVTYAWARTEDRIDGRDVPRRIDQPHTLNATIDISLASWNLSLAWRYHTGWPTTAIQGRFEVDDEGELEAVPTFGPRNAERLSTYHRLDLRTSREWKMDRGTLTFFLEIQNLYDRQNTSGRENDLELVVLPDGSIDIVSADEIWGGILPSFGITWEF